MYEEAKLGFKDRFGAGLPSIGDGSMLFIQNVAAKLAPVEQGGKAAIVLPATPCSTAMPAPARRTSTDGCSRRTTSTASSNCPPKSSSAPASARTSGFCRTKSPKAARA